MGRSKTVTMDVDAIQEKYGIQPQEDQYGNWGFRKVLVRKLHNFIYKEQYNQPRTSSQPDSRKDPWA